jgi:hypothetical protein
MLTNSQAERNVQEMGAWLSAFAIDDDGKLFNLRSLIFLDLFITKRNSLGDGSPIRTTQILGDLSSEIDSSIIMETPARLAKPTFDISPYEKRSPKDLDAIVETPIRQRPPQDEFDTSPVSNHNSFSFQQRSLKDKVALSEAHVDRHSRDEVAERASFHVPYRPPNEAVVKATAPANNSRLDTEAVREKSLGSHLKSTGAYGRVVNGRVVDEPPLRTEVDPRLNEYGRVVESRSRDGKPVGVYKPINSLPSKESSAKPSNIYRKPNQFKNKLIDLTGDETRSSKPIDLTGDRHKSNKPIGDRNSDFEFEGDSIDLTSDVLDTIKPKKPIDLTGRRQLSTSALFMPKRKDIHGVSSKKNQFGGPSIQKEPVQKPRSHLPPQFEMHGGAQTATKSSSNTRDPLKPSIYDKPSNYVLKHDTSSAQPMPTASKADVLSVLNSIPDTTNIADFCRDQPSALNCTLMPHQVCFLRFDDLAQRIQLA